MKERMSVLWLDVRIFIVKMLYLYLALLSWIGIILMIATIVFIPFVIYLRKETKWFAKPFDSAIYLGNDYYFDATDKWENKLKKIMAEKKEKQNENNFNEH